MAEKDDIPGTDNPDAVEGAEEKKKGGGLLMILLPVLLIAGGGGAFLAYAQYPALAEIAYNMGIGAGSEDEEDAEALIEYGEFMELSNIVVNPADSNGRRLLMISLGIETADPALLENITSREMVVRDTIIKILGQRTVAELAAIEQRNTIKDELRQAVNGIVQEGEINRMYFTQYVLQ